uniref:Uncharacterized protein n=1 Tax=Sphenodon punctatus TaxID=8508 RepID=A0A8D0GF39_SPHPU
MLLLQQRLNAAGIASKVDLLLDKINSENTAFAEPLPRAQSLCPSCTAPPPCRMATEELAALRSQLHCQAKVIESLTQSVHQLKQERDLQQHRIRHLEEEVDRLQQSPHGGLETLLGRRTEGLKGDLRNLRQQVFHQPDGDCTPDLPPGPSIMQEMQESKKLLWREYECVRREMEQLKHKLYRQGEDLFNQVSETDEIKRTQSQYCKMLEELMNSHKAQSHDLDKARMETQSTQQELGNIRCTVTDLKDQMKSLHLEEQLCSKPTAEEPGHRKRSKELLQEMEEALSSSLCDDSASELSLTDVSSDELSSEPEMKESDGSKELEESAPRGTAGVAAGGEENLSSELSGSLLDLNLSDL